MNGLSGEAMLPRQIKEKDMDNNQEPKKKTPQQLYIDEAAKAGAKEVLLLQRKQASTNHYRAMEDLLRAYKNTKLWEEHPEEYGFFPTGKSHDISIAPPPGLGLRDKVEINELFVQSRQLSFVRSMARFNELDAVIKLFQDKPEFVVVRMYYFNENANGEDRGGAKPYTFEEIAEELKTIGINRSVRALRLWRTKLVRDMTVMMFGVDGALSIESRGPKQGNKEGEADGET